MEEDEKEEVMGEVREGVGVRVGDDQGACKLDEPPPPPPPPPPLLFLLLLLLLLTVERLFHQPLLCSYEVFRGERECPASVSECLADAGRGKQVSSSSSLSRQLPNCPLPCTLTGN